MRPNHPYAHIGSTVASYQYASSGRVFRHNHKDKERRQTIDVPPPPLYTRPVHPGTLAVLLHSWHGAEADHTVVTRAVQSNTIRARLGLGIGAWLLPFA